MTEIRLRNSMSRSVEGFEPLDPANVRLYVCGPTVYDRAHLGNARPVVVFDVLFRLLRQVFGAAAVTYVRNFTDVDDKINAEAQRRKALGRDESLEQLIRERTDETIAWYHADMDALGALRPSHEPRATDYIPQMVAMTADLIARGHAYAVAGHVLFRVRSFEGYGALSGRSVDDMIAGARVEVAPFKEDPMDFVLWKPSEDGLPGWDSPWGRGRPGWHIECSAMADALLWEKMQNKLSPAALAAPHVIDIHGGGIDLQFPHHENEVAQSCCAHGDEQGAADPVHGFARYWVHNEMLLVEGRKMSKSLGNFFTVRDLLDSGIDGEVIRFVFLQTHYSKPMDWTEAKWKAAHARLARWGNLRSKWLSDVEQVDASVAIDGGVLEALSGDLNTSLAITRLMEMQGELEKRGIDARDSDEALCFFATLKFLGFKRLDPEEIRRDLALSGAATRFALEALAARLTELRATAMATKDFAPVDAMKAALLAAGVEVRMSKAGVELVPGAGFDAGRLPRI